MTIICIFNLVTKHHQFAATKLRKMADIMCWSWKLLTRWWTWFKDCECQFCSSALVIDGQRYRC